jgi:septal ring factor EnvC (AmiA/AmiB activator)
MEGTQTATFIAGIYGATVAGGTAVYINPSGHLGTVTSSARFKQEIQAMGKSSEVLLSLRPVTFRYKPELDPNGLAQFGLVAEEVANVDADLVVRDKEGKPYSVRYDQVNAMLLNEFLKEHQAFLKEQRKVEAQEATIAELKQDFQSKLAEQQRQIKALTSGLEKVSAQVEMSKSAPKTIVNNQ